MRPLVQIEVLGRSRVQREGNRPKPKPRPNRSSTRPIFGTGQKFVPKKRPLTSLLQLAFKVRAGYTAAHLSVARLSSVRRYDPQRMDGSLNRHQRGFNGEKNHSNELGSDKTKRSPLRVYGRSVGAYRFGRTLSPIVKIFLYSWNH
jgi:hypothetical protein